MKGKKILNEKLSMTRLAELGFRQAKRKIHDSTGAG